ncbi:flagellar protein export ATPase FliI [bacterium]|nr:flagellar protein export ATPase FliI [bacterium]
MTDTPSLAPLAQPPALEELFRSHEELLDAAQPLVPRGRVVRVVGLVIESSGPEASVGEICELLNRQNRRLGLAEVVGFRDHHVLLMPLGELSGIAPGSIVRSLRRPFTVKVGPGLLGRVLDGLGNVLDDLGPLDTETQVPITADPPHPLKRQRVTEPLGLGIRSIDGLLTCGKGQRFGIFAGSGVGKSVTMGMVARNTEAEVNVIALVGERGREVRDFIERDLGPEGLARSVVVVVTSDKPALIRIKGAMLATAIAEYFRDQGKDVMLMMDSVTRLAMAQREIGLAVGEPPTTRGYTPSVFAMLPKLLERAGRGDKGSITALYTVLVEGDDMNEPVADAVRSILDGHIVLSRKLATEGHYPAVDVLQSISRVMVEVVPDELKKAAKLVQTDMAVWRENEDLINIGAYKKGSNPRIDRAVDKRDEIENFLIQDMNEGADLKGTWGQVIELSG